MTIVAVAVFFIFNQLISALSFENNLQTTCEYDPNRKAANCSYLGLENVAQIYQSVPVDVEKLYLNGNSIREIKSHELKRYRQLTFLELGDNKLQNLTSFAFDGLDKLAELHLQYNQLNGKDAYPDDVFVQLKCLRILWIQGNCNALTQSCSYPDAAVSALSSLRYLKMDAINSSLGCGFSNLTNLETLYFDSVDGNCFLLHITVDTFAALSTTSLSELRIGDCGIKYIETNSLGDLRKLKILTIEGNRNLCSSGLENATFGLNKTKIEKITFKYWCRDQPNGITISKGMLSGLTDTSLKVLNLVTNGIGYIDPDVSERLPISLEYISLRDNYINNGHFLKPLQILNNLQVFDLSYQFDYTILPLNNMTFSQLYHFDVKLPKNLETVYMNNIKLGYAVIPLTFAPNRLRYLDMSRCLLKAFLGPWYGLKHLEVLNVSHNPFTLFHPRSLADMKNLKELRMQACQMGNSLSADTTGETFASQKSLEILDLSENMIKNLSASFFSHQRNLRHLTLAGNSLKQVSFSLKYMPRLHLLNLSGNEIETFSNENIDYLKSLDHSTSNLTIDLKGNMLSCTCSNVDFINWIADTKIHIHEIRDLTCLFENKNVLALARIQEIRSQLKYQCSLWVVLVSSIGGFVFLLLVFSILALLYHKRWQIRYLYYIGRNINPYHHPLEEKTILLELDAYISYDQTFDISPRCTLHGVVADHVYPALSDNGFSVKIRDELQGGKMLHDVITEAIRRSRHVIVLITPMYCKEFWNTFEFNMAAYEGIYTKRDVIIPVLFGRVFEKDLTTEIRSFIRSKINSNEVLCFDNNKDLLAVISKLLTCLMERLRH